MEHSENTSSTHNSDHEEYSGDSSDIEERQRSAHKRREQKRRNSIKEGYQALIDVLPTVQPTYPNVRMSRAQIEHKASKYVSYLKKQQNKLDEERISLEKEVLALRIIKANYEGVIEETLQQAPENDAIRLSEDAKFKVINAIMDEMFVSFDKLSMDNFEELTSGVIRWLEEYCKPSNIKKVVDRTLADIKAAHGVQPSSSKKK